MEKQVFVTAVDEVHDEEKDNLGDLRITGGKMYKYIKYNNGTANLAGSAGDAVAYYDNGTAGDGYSNNEVTKDTSDGVGPLGAGVLVAAMTDGDYGWIQIKGFDTLNQAVAGSASDGDPLTLGTDGALTRANDQGSGSAGVNRVAIGVDVSAKEVLLDFPY